MAATPITQVPLNPGDRYAGTPLNLKGQPTHHLVLLAARPSTPMDWEAAKAWAASVGGELPTRQEQALLYANCKPHLTGTFHWSGEEHEENASLAWDCYFDGGNQSYGHKSREGSAVAVRRLPLESLNPFGDGGSSTQEAAGTFTHTPRPALIPVAHQEIRRFGTGEKTLDYQLECSSESAQRMRAEIRTLRDAERDVADLRIKLGNYTNAEITVELTADEMRDVARRLIDAAHDIEAHPAAALAREAQDHQQAQAEVMA
jgi:hypothetical protein